MSSEFFEHVQQIFDTLNYPKTAVDNYQFFTRELGFLDNIICFQSYIDEQNNMLLDVAQKAKALLLDDAVKFPEFYLSSYFDCYTSEVQNRILLAKMEIRSRYSFPKITTLPNSAKFVTEFILSVLENVGNLVKIHGPCSLLCVYESILQHIEDVSKELKLLWNFVCFVSERFIAEPESENHHINNFVTHVLAVAGHTSTLIWLYLPDLDQEEINVLFSDFLRMRIKPIQPCIRKIYVDVLQSLKSTKQSTGWYPNNRNEDVIGSEASFVDSIIHNLAELPSNCNTREIRVSLEYHLAILQKMLNLLRANIICVPIQDLEILLQDVETVIIDVGLLVYSLYEDEEEMEDMAKGEVNPALFLDLSGNIQRINKVIYLTIRKAFQSNLPRIAGLGYVDFLLNNLKEFQSRHSDSLDNSLANKLQIIKKELESLQPFLEAVAGERHNDFEKIQRCATQLIGKAREVEYIIYACVSKEIHVWFFELWLLDIMEEITLVKDEVAMIHEKKMVGDAIKTITAHVSSNSSRSPMMNEEIVGFEEVIEKLRDHLIKGTRGRDVISIVGMPGLGKTTLAYRLYYDRLVVSHFDIHAQCCVSQVYSRKDLLLAILHDVVGEDSKRREKPADELADELRKALFSKRYLILIDDVWETSAWDDLIGCFGDSNNGSRIILTTRNHDIANYAKFQSDPLPLRMFHADESWELLRTKVLGEESCSHRLKDIGMQIAKKCGQLPLSVALVAGILAKLEKKEECWEQVASNLGPHIHRNSRAIIEHSYQNLPYHLRSCFLYFGAFLEDSVINVSKLIWLWISEGFVKSCKGKSLEDIAEGYLDNLIGRNLVMGTKKSFGGKIKACYIHDLLHDFCKERAKEENLVQWIKRDQKANLSSRVYNPKQLANRISIYDEGYHIWEWSSSLSPVDSLILHKNCLVFATALYVFHRFKFLKVLNLEFTFVDHFPTDLVYLRYFAARSYVWSISSLIDNRRNLETLVLHNYPTEMSLPFTLWKMDKLRHLHISKCSFIVDDPIVFRINHKELKDLKTLSTPYFSCVQDAELILQRTPNLRLLKCEVKGVTDFQYCVLNFPIAIEKLKIQGEDSIPFCISAPNLKNLTLVSFSLHPQRLSEIALLQNLQVLKLQGIKFNNKEWKVSIGEFLQLKVLKLQEIIYLQEWSVEDDSFPNLERLVLHRCHNLKEIPSCFGDFCSLKYIEVDCCNKFVDKSVREIWETQVEVYQNTGFEVFIH